MNIKSSVILGASAIISSIILGLALRTQPTQSEISGRAEVASDAAIEPQLHGYQIIGFKGHVYILDTATGRTWGQDGFRK